jgi:uncharacterized protein YcbK (DUF882 family)
MRLFAHSCPACEGASGYVCDASMVARRSLLGLGAALLAAPALAQSVAGSTRRISLRRMQTGEAFDGIYWRDGHYDRAALQRLDWVMRDPRQQEATPMDPRLFDVLVSVQTRLGSNET